MGQESPDGFHEFGSRALEEEEGDDGEEKFVDDIVAYPVVFLRVGWREDSSFA